MKIAFIGADNPADIRSWSGTPISMMKAMQRIGFEMVPFFPRNRLSRNSILMRKIIPKLVFKKRTFPDRTITECKRMSADVQAQIQGNKFDLILAPGSLPVAYLVTDLPIIIWTDATFPSTADFYPEYSNLSKRTMSEGVEIDRIAFSRAAKSLFSSSWAATGATERLGIPTNKVHVLYFGSNMDLGLSRTEVETSLAEKKQANLKLLWIGIDWKRKRGDFAAKVVKSLISKGLQAELHVIGCMPPKEYETCAFVKIHGFIAKTTLEGQKRISTFLRNSHFLILPSEAECSPIVIPEAASHGVPALVTDVGGNSELLIHEKSGFCFPLCTEPSVVADWVQKKYKNWSSYEALALAAHDDYSTRINWDKSARAAKKMMEETLA